MMKAASVVLVVLALFALAMAFNAFTREHGVNPTAALIGGLIPIAITLGLAYYVWPKKRRAK